MGQAQTKTEWFDRVGEDALSGNGYSPSPALEKYKGALYYWNHFIIWKPLKITLCPPCRLFRCTLTNIPQTQALLNKAKLPLGLLLHPFKDLSVWQIFKTLNAEISTIPVLKSRAGQWIIKEGQVHWLILAQKNYPGNSRFTVPYRSL